MIAAIMSLPPTPAVTGPASGAASGSREAPEAPTPWLPGLDRGPLARLLDQPVAGSQRLPQGPADPDLPDRTVGERDRHPVGNVLAAGPDPAPLAGHGACPGVISAEPPPEEIPASLRRDVSSR